MASRIAGRPQKAKKHSKTDPRQEKRKREQEDIQKLEEAVANLVSCHWCTILRRLANYGDFVFDIGSESELGKEL